MSDEETNSLLRQILAASLDEKRSSRPYSANIAAYESEKELKDEWRKFGEAMRIGVENAKNELAKAEKARLEAAIDAITKDGASIPNAIREALANASMPGLEPEKAAAFFDEATKYLKDTYGKDNPQIQKVITLLENEKKKVSAADAGQDALNDAKPKFDTLYRQSEIRVRGFFDKLNIKFAGYENSPWYVILKDMAEGKETGGMFMQAYFNNIGTNVKRHLEPLNLFINAMRMVKEETTKLVQNMDMVQVAFLRSTGFASDFADVIENTWDDVKYFGVSLEEVSKTIDVYINKFSAFSKMNEKEQGSLIKLGATMSRLGVSVEESSAIYDYFQSSLKRGSGGAERGLLNIAGIAETLGESFSKISGEFVSMLPTLAKWGQQTENVFRNLEAVRKSLNITAQEVLNIAQGFDTFDSAAQHVGKLNAILGGPFLNSIQLLNSSEGEVVQQLNLAFKASGKNWQALSRHERQAIATAAGITDMNVAQKLFNGSLADVNMLLAQQSISQEEVDKRSQRATTITEKFTIILQTLAFAAEPILDVLQWIAGAALSVAETLQGWTIPAFFLLFGLLGGGIGKLISLGGFLGKLPFKLLGLIPGLGGVAAGLGSVGGAAGAVAAPALGARITGFFTGLGTGIASFITSMASVVAMAGPAALAILLVGGAIAIVAGIFAVFLGVAVGIAGFFGSLGDAVKTDALTDFAATVGDMSNNVPGKFSSMAASVDLMSKAISNIPSANIDSYISLMESIEEIASSAQSNFSSQFLGSLSDVLTSVSVNPSIKSNSFFATGTSEAEKEKTDTIQMLMSKLNEIIAALKGGGTGPVTTGTRSASLSIEIDGAVLADKVIEVIEDRWRVR